MARNNKHKKGFALGALVGGLLGGMTALLFAPKTGEKMRKDLGKKVDAVSKCSCRMAGKAKGMATDCKKTLKRFWKS